MPILNKKNINESCSMGIWEITESKVELMEMCVNGGFSINEIKESKNDLLVKQWLAVRLLVGEFYPESQITYNEFGKPYLTNGVEISISHSGNYAVIILNTLKKCGVDIEKISSKVERIKHKFLTLGELETLNSIEELTIFWCAKEALYKLYGEKELIFNEHLSVGYSNRPYYLNGRIKTDRIDDLHELMVEKIGDYILVYTM